MNYQLLFLTIVISCECFIKFYKVNCDEIRKNITQVKTTATAIKLAQVDNDYNSKKLNLNELKVESLESIIGFELNKGESFERVKRQTEKSRRKGGNLAARPKSTTTTTTTNTTTTLAPATDDSSGEEEEEEDSVGLEGDSNSENNAETKEAEVEKTQARSTPAPAPPPTRGTVGKGRRKETAPPISGTNGTSSKAGGTKSANKNKGKIMAKKKKPLVALPFIKPKNDSICTPEAYLEFPKDLIGNKWRSRGLVLIHIAVVCYMFYSLALVCERYFMPSLEEFAQRLQLSEDVAGATLMSAGSSAPELFTALLGVFVAKGDVGTGAIVGSAVFNILFVIGICAFVSTTSAQLNWWPVLRDSVFYTFTVLVLILFIYDERITAMESFTMIALYGLYIIIMVHNDLLKLQVTKFLQSYPITAKLFSTTATTTTTNQLQSSGATGALIGADDVFDGSTSSYRTNINNEQVVEDDSMFLAACLVVVKHKRLFKSQLRFQMASRYIICKRQHKVLQQQQQQQQQQQKMSKQVTQSNEVNYFGPESEPITGGRGAGSRSQKDKHEAYATSASLSKNKFSIVSKDDYEFWNKPPEVGENYYLWLAKIPVNYVLHYTIPDCTLYPDKYLLTFIISITWTAFFSYIMVWMVTLIGYTFGIPDSVMGVTFLAAGTSVPDCYSSVHAARNGMADMAVSNSIGSNVFDILIGLSLPWFIQTAIYPGVVATINSRGVIYSVILLFLSLIVTIYLMNKYEWTLKPRLGLALLIAYGLFIVLTCMLEFNLFGHVNPPPCIVN